MCVYHFDNVKNTGVSLLGLPNC